MEPGASNTIYIHTVAGSGLFDDYLSYIPDRNSSKVHATETSPRAKIDLDVYRKIQ